jgi:hypothetical protein
MAGADAAAGSTSDNADGVAAGVGLGLPASKLSFVSVDEFFWLLGSRLFKKRYWEQYLPSSSSNNNSCSGSSKVESRK